MGYTAAVITISDKGYRGERTDTSGPALCARLAEAGWNVVYQGLVPDETAQIQSELLHCTDELKTALVLTTGGTGFSPRDITPEATAAVIERATPGISETMRAESVKITPRGCLSRGVSGIRKQSLIINLPGSRKAALENLDAVMGPLQHGLDMLYSAGSADCGNAPEPPKVQSRPKPSLDQWLQEAKQDPAAANCGMYLMHNGVVRQTARARVRNGETGLPPVKGLSFSYDREKLEATIQATKAKPGIGYVRVWLNEGELSVGDDIMMVLVGGDIRLRVTDALQSLVEEIKQNCVAETERYES